MTSVIANVPRFTFTDNTGRPASGYMLYTYLAGSTTLVTTWQDQGHNSENTNPITLDADGGCYLWLDADKEYKLVLKTAAGAPVRTMDNVSGSLNTADLLAMLAASSGASLIGFNQSGAGAEGRTLEDKVRESVSVNDFMTDADRTANYLAPGSVDVTYAITAALATLLPTGGTLYFPRGTYLTDQIDLRGYSNITLLGENHTAEFAFKPGVEIKTRTACDVGIKLLDPTDQTQLGAPVGGAQYIAIQNIYLNANNLADYGINMNKSVTVGHFAVRHAVMDGIVFEAYTFPVSLRHVVSAYNGRHGLTVKAPGTTIYTLTDCEFSGNGGDGINAVAGNTCVFDNVRCQSNTGNGFSFFKPDPATYTDSTQMFLSRLTFIGCYAEANGGTSLAINSYNEDPASFTGKITDLTFIGCSLASPSVEGCSRITSFASPGLDNLSTAKNTIGLDEWNVWQAIILNAGRIKFPATANPSTDVNTLDEYKEGDFTPTIEGSTAAGTCSYSSQIGRYVKIGKLVYFTMSVTWTGHTGTGNLVVAGFPVRHEALGTVSVFTVQANNITIPAGGQGLFCQLTNANPPKATIFYDAISAIIQATALPMDPSGTLIISGQYMATT